MDSLHSISPIDGKYAGDVKSLSGIFSESALIQYRTSIEIEYLIALSKQAGIKLKYFDEKEYALVRKLHNLSEEQVSMVKQIETQGYQDIPATNHDVKAVEYFIKTELEGASLERAINYIHFALTSEDINSFAYGLSLSDGLSKVIIPSLEELLLNLEKISNQNKKSVMLGRTHGQPASPTTFGKEIKVFAKRLEDQLENLKKQKISVKLSGATGNYNAHIVAYPDIDWIAFTKKFAKGFNSDREIELEPNFFTTQIDPGDSYAEIFDNLRRINVILIDLSRDIWTYISDGWLKQQVIKGEVGSSTMPHKINPINFENAEGNLGVANALFTHFSNKLPISRLQRDLSDSTVKRNFGVAFGHSLVGYKALMKGLKKINVDKAAMLESLQSHPEIISEAIQTILRREGLDEPYEKLKQLTKGENIKLSDIHKFIDKLDIPSEVKKELKKTKPENYTGLASV